MESTLCTVTELDHDGFAVLLADPCGASAEAVCDVLRKLPELREFEIVPDENAIRVFGTIKASCRASFRGVLVKLLENRFREES